MGKVSDVHQCSMGSRSEFREDFSLVDTLMQRYQYEED